jgi:hypothetical protein
MNGEREEKNACPTAIPSAAPLLELHASHLATFERCQMIYYYRYPCGIKIRPPIALPVGSATHAAIEMNMRHKKETHELAPKDAVLDCARDTLQARIDDEGLALTEDEHAKGLGVVIGEAKDKAVRLSKLHYEAVAPGIEPLEIEREWRIEITGKPIVLVGRIDLEVAGGVRDSKTAGKTPMPDAADRSLQLTTYAIAYRVLNGGVNPSVLALDFLVDTKKPEWIPQTTTRTEADMRAFLRRVEVAAKVIASGNYTPCSRDAMSYHRLVCSKETCGYFGMCEFVR